MLDIKWIRANPEKLDENLLKRGMTPNAQEILNADSRKRQLTTTIQKLLHDRRTKSNIAAHMHDKSSKDFVQLQEQVKSINQEIDVLASQLQDEQAKLAYILDMLPNLLADDVPVGSSSVANAVIKKWGVIPNIEYPKHHYEIGVNLDMMDFTTAAKMSGTRFVILKHDLAKLERALINFMIDIHTSRFGFFEVSPPYLVRDEAMYNVAQLPKFDNASFRTTDGYRLVTTGEVPLTNIFAHTTIPEEKLPVRLVAFTPCFRSEAGSAGKDTKGMLRTHQFNKVELVTVVTPEEAESEFKYLINAAVTILEELALPYQLVNLCSGDIGFASQKTYDIEVWLPAQNCYREISSCSYFGDFQARRAKSKYQEINTKGTKFLHTINGSGLAIGRTIIAILENYQNVDGSVTIPEKLRSYMGGQKLITTLTRKVF